MSDIVDNFIGDLVLSLRNKVYSVETDPTIPGLTARAYAVLDKPHTAIFTKFYNHLLVLDWENDLFGQLERLLNAQKVFSGFVNKSYRIPHAWRLTLPNLVLLTVSEYGFNDETRNLVLNKYFVPLLGGESGQIMLADLEAKSLTCHFPPHYREYASIPLESAVIELANLFTSLVPGGKLLRD